MSDYVGFIKKIMKLMQKGYDEIQALEVELKILEETSAPPSRPREYDSEIRNISIMCCSFCLYSQGWVHYLLLWGL